jgi:hypothetical protein
VRAPKTRSERIIFSFFLKSLAAKSVLALTPRNQKLFRLAGPLTFRLPLSSLDAKPS